MFVAQLSDFHIGCMLNSTLQSCANGEMSYTVNIVNQMYICLRGDALYCKLKTEHPATLLALRCQNYYLEGEISKTLLSFP